MKKTAVLLIAILFVASNFIYAQQKKPKMSFEKEIHNFGNIKQDGGNADYQFVFTNTGAKPIIITDVKSSCGCTTPSWSKEPVAPGAKGYITAAYNPDKRPGHFSKTITVTSNAENSPITLTITGDVGELAITPEKEYPTKVGILRMNTNHANFAAMSTDETKTTELYIYNPTQETANVVPDPSYIPKYLNVTITPSDIKPGEKSTMKIFYDASKVNDWDYVRGTLYLKINGKRESKTRINVSAVISEKFTEKQKKNSPKIEFETKEFNFGKITEGEKVDYTYTFKNTGKTDLYIRKTKASCGCTAVNQSKEAIRPGENGTIKVTFNSTHKKGMQNKIITVITNCAEPKDNKILLKIKGEVTPAEKK